MLDAGNIAALIAGGETISVEFKQAMPRDGVIGETICAFANDIAGTHRTAYLLLGVANNGAIAGVAADDRMLQALAQLRTDGSITPTPTMTVYALGIGDVQIAVIEVEPSDSPPVRRKGTAFVRVGTVTTRATPEDERRLVELRRAKAIASDVRGLPGTSILDLDLVRFHVDYLRRAVSAEVLQENNRSVEQQLASLKMIDGGGLATVAGMLTLGVHPQHRLPMAYIQFRRVAGIDIADNTLDQGPMAGTLDNMARQIEEKLHALNASPLTIGPYRHSIEPAYPMAAMSQIVRNAIMHRDYEISAPVRVTWFENRVQIDSPGAPYQIDATHFGQPGFTAYRNPNIAEVMHNLGLAERFGVGLAIAARALERNGNPPLQLHAEGNFVFATLRPRSPPQL